MRLLRTAAKLSALAATRKRLKDRRLGRRIPRSGTPPLERGLQAHRAGQLDDALAIYESLIQNDPTLAQAHSLRGVVLLQRHDDAAALESLDRAIALSPDDHGSHINRGNALRRLGRFDEAADAFDAAIRLSPESEVAHINLGNVRRDIGDDAAALDSYRRALSLEPSSFEAAASVAHSLQRTDADDAATIAAYRIAVELAGQLERTGPQVADCHNGLGNRLASNGEIDEALEQYALALQSDADFVEAHFNTSRLLAGRAQYAEAAEALRLGLQRDPTQIGAYKHLAILLRRLGRNEEAGEVYRQWHARDPGNPIAAHMARLDAAQPPSRAAQAYVEREFDEFADNFEKVLARLDYRAPQLIDAAVQASTVATRNELTVLDAGCGTGLCGPYLRPRARRLVGVDLSQRMLDIARRRRIYDELVVAELVAYLKGQTGVFDVITAADVFVYFGDLRKVLAACRAAMRARSVLLFTVEAAGTAVDYELNAGGRFAHGRPYIETLLPEAGLHISSLEPVVLRQELGEDVRGWCVVAELSEPHG